MTHLAHALAAILVVGAFTSVGCYREHPIQPPKPPIVELQWPTGGVPCSRTCEVIGVALSKDGHSVWICKQQSLGKSSAK